jgi:hypothetical protein
MAVIERENQNRVFSDMTNDSRRAVQIASAVPQASGRRRAPERGDGAEMFQVICDPYEWKSAIRVALVIFAAFLALAPALAPDQKKLAAKINHQTLKAAAAIKSTTR